MVVPMWGLYANLVAQVISQISSHFIIYYHRRVVKATAPFHHELNEMSKSSNGTHFARAEPLNHAGSHISIRRSALVTVSFICICSMLLFMIGSLLPSLELDSLGVLGIVAELGEKGASYKKLSLFDMIVLIMDQAKYIGEGKEMISLGCLCAIFVLTALIVPLLLGANYLLLWLIPSLKVKSSKRILTVIEVLKAWQYCEVFLISLLIATLQLSELSGFIVNEYCGNLQPLFDALVRYGLIAERDAQCFLVSAKLGTGFYIFFAATVLMAVVSTVVVSAGKVIVADKEIESNQTHPKHDMMVAVPADIQYLSCLRNILLVGNTTTENRFLTNTAVITQTFDIENEDFNKSSSDSSCHSGDDLVKEEQGSKGEI
jgi:hypothetical protein